MAETKATITQEELLRWAGVAAKAIGATAEPHEEYEPDGPPAVRIGGLAVRQERDWKGVFWEVGELGCYSDLHEALASAVSDLAYGLASEALKEAGLAQP